MSDTPENLIKLSVARAIKAVNDALIRSAKGLPLPIYKNAALVLRHAPAFHKLLACNQLTSEAVITGPPPRPTDDAHFAPGPYPRPLTEADYGAILEAIQEAWIPRISAQIVAEAVNNIAAERTFHPIRDYLDKLTWDGKPRLNSWLSATFNAENNPYTQAIGSRFLIGAVRRIRQPGCQFDYMLVLEGEQGIGKSTALRKLFGDQYFTDDLPHDLSAKDAPMAMATVWCVELADLSQLLSRRADAESIKAFITRRVDRYRPPYARALITHPRQNVLTGTTNRSDWLSTDDTGNRRFWPVHCPLADPHWIELNRDQLWAETTHREAQGEPAFLDTPDLIAEATTEQEARHEEDPWTTPISEFLANKAIAFLPERRKVVIGDVLTNVGLYADRQDRRAQMRAAKVVHKLGWKRMRVTNDKTKERQWSWVHASYKERE